MPNDLTQGVRSHAALFGHPLHPMVVPFPIAFLVGALVTDLVFLGNADPFWAEMSKWLILAALVMGALAAVLGLIDFLTIKRVREGNTGWMHMGGNVIAVLLSLFSLIYRWPDPAAAVVPVGLTISVIVSVILVFTGWLGGELVFRRKIGVMNAADTAATRRQQPFPAE